MNFKIYYKKFIDGVNKPVVCSKKDEYHVMDFSILKEDVAKSFNPEDIKVINKVKNTIIQVNSGECIAYKDCYIGENTITWHFSKNVVEDGQIEF